MNDLMRKVNPALLRNHLHQLLLHLLRSVSFGQSQPARNPEHVRIHNHALGLLEADAQHDVSSLPGSAWNRNQLRECLRHLAAKLRRNLLSRTPDGLGLVMKKASGANQRFKLRQSSLGHRRRRREAFEQLRRNHVDAYVRTLRGKNGRHQQFPRRPVVERALHLGIRFIKPIEDSRDAVRDQVAT